MTQVAIITGDIVASQKISSKKRKALYTALEKFLSGIEGKWIQGYETYRGDSLQCRAISPEEALRAALLIRTFVMSFAQPLHKKGQKNGEKSRGYFNNEFDIRLAIGVGAVDFVRGKKIATSDGEAFQLSGESLDRLKDQGQRLICKTAREELNRDLEPLVLLLDAVAEKWTRNQAELLLHKLHNKRDEEIAAELGISLSAVNQRKKTAQWPAIEKAVQYFAYKMKTAL
ncbi:MAG TPA: hypothetical protein VIK80_16485 [Flavihumibacter sp.]|jgi:hypothetical protein